MVLEPTLVSRGRLLKKLVVTVGMVVASTPTPSPPLTHHHTHSTPLHSTPLHPQPYRASRAARTSLHFSSALCCRMTKMM